MCSFRSQSKASAGSSNARPCLASACTHSTAISRDAGRCRYPFLYRKLFAPDLSHAASQTSGSVIVDLDKKEVRGIISGYITKVGEIELDFAWKFQSNNYSDSPTVYRRGHINGLTGEAWQVDSRSDLLVPKSDTADYAAFDLVCKRAARAIRFRGSGN